MGAPGRILSVSTRLFGHEPLVLTNLHENRPGSFQSEDLIFATWHNAGLRVFDIGNAHEPKEVAHFVPGPPERIVDIRPGAERVVQSTDVFAASDGTLFVTDTNGGLSILAYEG